MILAVKQRLNCIARPAIALAFLLCLGACDSSPKKVQLQGGVFGITWHVTYHGEPDGLSDNDVEAAITSAFSVVDDSMNNYRASSMLSQLNSLPAGQIFEVDWDFALVFNAAVRRFVDARSAQSRAHFRDMFCHKRSNFLLTVLVDDIACAFSICRSGSQSTHFRFESDHCRNGVHFCKPNCF